METIDDLIHCLAGSKCSVNVSYHQINTCNCYIIMSKCKGIGYASLVYCLATVDEIVKHTKVKDHNYQNK